MKVLCDVVVERVALDEPLGDLANHVKACSRCQRLVAMPGKLAAARQVDRNRRDGDPGLGFSARMTVGAQQRIAVRHRRRLVGSFAAVTAAGVAAVVFVTRSPDPQPATRDNVAMQPIQVPEVEPQRPIVAAPADLQMLVNLSDTRAARRASAPWGRIQRPLKPYKKLVKGVVQ